MNHKLRKLALITTAALLLAGSASAISFSGSVAAKNTLEIYAPTGGTVESVEASVGQRVQAGDVLATLATTRVYAAEAGEVTGIFAQAGDDVAMTYACDAGESLVPGEIVEISRLGEDGLFRVYISPEYPPEYLGMTVNVRIG